MEQPCGEVRKRSPHIEKNPDAVVHRGQFFLFLREDGKEVLSSSQMALSRQTR